MVRLLLRLRALHQVERLLWGRPLVYDRADPADHADRIRGLPDVPSHVDATGPLLDRLIREFEGIKLRLQFGASRNDERHRAGFDDLREVVAEIGLDEMRAELRGDPTREAEVPRVAFLEFLAARGHREDRDADLLALIDEFPEVHQGIVLMGRPDEDGESDRGRVQADGLFHRRRDLLVRQVLIQDARPAAHAEYDRDVRPRIDRGADHASGD